jgi:zinc/manganese transport system substrate-binding protein
MSNASAAELKVVASFSIIADFARNVGGDRVEISTLVGPNGDAHVYEPRPADAVALEAADVILVNGFHFEGFMTRLIDASGTKAPVVEVTKGIEPRTGFEEDEEPEAETKPETAQAQEPEAHDHSGIDPHAWQSIPNGEIYVKNIADAFCKTDEAGCKIYTANADAYIAKLKQLETEVKAGIGAIPEDKRTVITSHDAFGYFAQAYGLTFIAPEGISTEAEASAADVARLIDQVKQDKASAIFVENITNPRLIERISAETGIKTGGTLYSDALSTSDGPASTYIDMFRYNVNTLKAAILGS